MSTLLVSNVYGDRGCGSCSKRALPVPQQQAAPEPATTTKAAPAKGGTVAVSNPADFNAYLASNTKVAAKFSATWCPPCRAEIPHLVALANKFKDKNVQIVGVALDRDKASVSSFVKQQKVNYTIALDPGAEKLGNLYKVGGIPATYVIDQKGLIRYVHSGFPVGNKEAQQSEAAALEREVNSLLGK